MSATDHKKDSTELEEALRRLDLISLEETFYHLRSRIGSKPLESAKITLSNPNPIVEAESLPPDQMWVNELSTKDLFNALYNKLNSEIPEFDLEDLERWEKKVSQVGSAASDVLAISTFIHQQIMIVYQLICVEIGRERGERALEGGV